MRQGEREKERCGYTQENRRGTNPEKPSHELSQTGHALRIVTPEVKHVKFTCLKVRVCSCQPGSRALCRSDRVGAGEGGCGCGLL